MKQREKTFNKPWRYALAMFGLSITGYMYTAFGTYYYSDKMGLSFGAIATATVLFSIWDAFNDPIMGLLSDRTRSKWGRRKPWLVVSVPLFALSAIAFFSPPAMLGQGFALAAYFTFFLMLTETANTIASVNYHSLLPELFRQQDSRNRANAIRQAWQLVGMIIGVSLVSMLANQMGFSMTAVVLSLLGGAVTLYSVLGCKEREEFSQLPRPSLSSSFRAVVVNRNFWLVSASHFFYQATSGLLLAGIPFYVKFVLKLPDINATFLSASVFVPAIPAMLLWYRLIKRRGALRTWRMALLFLGISLVPFYFLEGLLFACLFGAFIGVGIAGVTANLDMINSELIEEDARVSGHRREATFFSAISFVTRLSGLVRSGVFVLMLTLFGFQSGVVPGDRPEAAVRAMMSLFPVSLMVISYILANRVSLGEQSAGADGTGLQPPEEAPAQDAPVQEAPWKGEAWQEETWKGEA